MITCFVFLSISSLVLGQKTQFNVWTPETVVLYRGIENPIELVYGGISPNDLSVSLSDDVNLKGYEDYIAVFVPGDFEENSVKMTVKTKQGDEILEDAYTFRVMDIPQPNAFLGKLDPKELQYSKEDVLENLSFTITNSEYFPYDTKYKIVSYNFFIIRRGVTNKITVKGDNITEKIIEFVKTADEPSQNISFQLELEGPDGISMETSFSVNIFNGWDE